MRFRALSIRGTVAVAAFATLFGVSASPAVEASPVARATPQPSDVRPVTTVNPCAVPDGMVVPKPGFNPLTATAAELRAQDFPPRPRPGEGGMAAWEQYARWYLAGDVYRCGTATHSPNTGGGSYGP